MSELVNIENVSASYSGKIVLRDITLSIREGDFIGVIGPNGGGKTTLLLLILNLMSPASGRIRWLNDRVKPHRIGYLPQLADGDRRFPLSVLDVVLSGLMSGKKSWGKMSKEDRKKAESTLENLGISELAGRSLDQLSGGEMQRVYLARALVGDPVLLLLDEPGNFVDSSFEQDFYDKLRDLNERMTILMVSHDVGTISTYVKSFACVNRDLHYHDSSEISAEQLKGYGCPIQLITHGEVPHTVLGKHDS